MIGCALFAGLAESPGDTIIYRGRSFKTYRGMGSIGAMAKGSHERYRQEPGTRIHDKDDKTTPNQKLVPEESRGLVPHKGTLLHYFRSSSLVLRLASQYGLLRRPHNRRPAHQTRFIQVSIRLRYRKATPTIVITQ